jgi:2-polyprenyl-3-methyl-5-hydroxy-6-metoxy-1,4-benzoquinol methylase
MAEKGLEVHAWDISAEAIEKLKRTAQQQDITLHTQVRDVVDRPPEPNNYDVIVVSRFLERELCPDIIAALKPEGLLFYQTYTQEKKCNIGPSNTVFLLKKGELPELFSTLKVITYQEGDEAMLVAQKKA